MTTLEIVLALFQSVFFIIAGSYLKSHDEKEYQWKLEKLERKRKLKTQPLTPEDFPKKDHAGEIVFYCGVFGLFATLSVLIFFY